MPLLGQEAPRPVETRPAPRPLPRRAPGRSTRAWFTAASLAGALALGTGWMLRAHFEEEPEKVHASVPEEAEEDGGTVAVGDSALTAPVPPSRAPVPWSTLAEDLPPRPFPGQRRPNANGRCPEKPQVPINGGCWIKLPVELKDCGEDGYVYKGACYMPVIPPTRPPTSSPTEHAGDAGAEH